MFDKNDKKGNVMKKVILKSLPYLGSFIAGTVLFLIGFIFEGNVNSILLNLSASFIAIPLIFLFYQSIENYSKRKLNREIMDYAKLHVDNEILSIINQLQKIIYPLDKKDSSFSGINKFLALKKEDLAEIIKINEYLGFQVFKHWEITENKITEILKHPLSVKYFDDELIICIISILKNIRTIQNIQKQEGLYFDTDKLAKNFKIVNGSQLNPDNEKYPDRCLLLKELKDDKFLVLDFGDISLYNMSKTLHYFKINPKFVNIFSEAIYNILQEFNKWGSLTGNEFIIDTQNYRIIPTKQYANSEKIKFND